MAHQTPKTIEQLKASNDEAISLLDAAINKLHGLLSIQTQRRKHDAQNLDQTQPAVDILDANKNKFRTGPIKDDTV